MEVSPGEAVLLRLFKSDLDEALQLVFLSLDPESLKASRLVCKAWNTFIKRRVWGSPSARLGLKGRLLRHWKGASAPVNNLLGDKCKEVYSMACDEERVYCGLLTSTSRCSRLPRPSSCIRDTAPVKRR